MSTDNELIIAFVQGAKWWEYKKTLATMWQSDQEIALEEAEKRLEQGTLGKPLEYLKGEKKMSGKYWDKAWSLVDGCTQCSPGCDNCWSMAIGKRFGKWPDKVTPRYDRLDIPLHVKKPTVWSIWNDFAHEDLPKDFIHDVMDIVAQCPQHTFLALTKRPQNIHYKQFDNFPNWWIGLTVCTQAEADEKLPIFLQVPGKKFLSVEPMLENINIEKYLRCSECGYARGDQLIHWDHNLCKGKIPEIESIVAGAETGPHARPCDPDWLRSIRDQCQVAGVPFWLKQVDKKGNRLLDGREWNERLFGE